MWRRWWRVMHEMLSRTMMRRSMPVIIGRVLRGLVIAPLPVPRFPMEFSMICCCGRGRCCYLVFVMPRLMMTRWRRSMVWTKMHAWPRISNHKTHANLRSIDCNTHTFAMMSGFRSLRRRPHMASANTLETLNVLRYLFICPPIFLCCRIEIINILRLTWISFSILLLISRYPRWISPLSDRTAR